MMLDVAAIKLNDHSIIHAVLETVRVTGENISKDTLYVSGKGREVESCDSNKVLIKDKAYEHLFTICRRERNRERTVLLY